MSRHDPFVTALKALVFVLSDDALAHRLLDLTGLTADDLRRGAQDPDTLAAVIDFLAQNEADLLACAAALDMPPTDIIAARQHLAPAPDEEF